MSKTTKDYDAFIYFIFYMKCRSTERMKYVNMIKKVGSWTYAAVTGKGEQSLLAMAAFIEYNKNYNKQIYIAQKTPSAQNFHGTYWKSELQIPSVI